MLNYLEVFIMQNLNDTIDIHDKIGDIISELEFLKESVNHILERYEKKNSVSRGFHLFMDEVIENVKSVGKEPGF